MLELDLGFDPEAACPGEEVHFFFSLENVGDQEEMVTLSVTLTFEEQEFGPFEGEFPLAAGEEIARELMFWIHHQMPPGILLISVTATDSDGTVEDEAQFEVLDCRGAKSGNPKPFLKKLSNELRRELGVK